MNGQTLSLVKKTCLFIFCIGAVFSLSAQQSGYTFDLPGNLQAIIVSGAGPPSITAQPQAQLVSSNSSVTLSVNASGTGLSYQWLSNGIPIPGATGDSLLLTNPPLTGSNVFSVIISNTSGYVVSTPANLWLDSNNNGIPDWWELQYFGNLNQTADGDYDGDGVSNLDEYREGTNPANAASYNPRLYLQGFHGQAVASPAQPYYTMGQSVTLTAMPDPGQQFLNWSGSITATNSPITVTMNGHKTITANFGIPLPTALDDTNLIWTTGGNASWFGQTEVSEDGIGAAQSGTMVCPMSASYVWTPQQSWLQAVATLNQPMLLEFWWNVSSIPPDSLTFSIDGTNIASLSGPAVGWQFLATKLSSGTHTLTWTYSKSSSGTLTNSPCSDAGWVDRVIIAPAAAFPAITSQPQSQNVLVGANLSLNVIATGALPMVYQWYFNSVTLAGATNASLFLTNLQSSASGNYSVTLTNAFGSVTSTAAVLRVLECVNPPAGLVSWWPGDSNANDTFSTNNGILEGGATANLPGLTGEAFAFNGSTSYVEIPDSPTLQLSALTIECWFDSSNNYGMILGKPVGPAYNDSYSVWLQGNNLQAKICNSGAQGPGLAIPFNAVAGVWYHVAYTYDSVAQTQSLYLNGNLVASGAETTLVGYDSHAAYIGADSDYGSLDLFWQGEIDEVSLYNRALTSNEIAGIYAAAFAGKCHALSNPFGFDPNPGGLQWTTNGLSMRLTGLTGGGQVIVYASTDLISWTPVYTNPPATGTIFFLDSTATNFSHRFYKAVEQ